MQICEKTIRQAFGKELGKKGVVSKNCEAEPAGFQKRVWSAVVINLEKGVVIFVFALEKKKICEPTARDRRELGDLLQI